jgi:hypothetical protein
MTRVPKRRAIESVDKVSMSATAAKKNRNFVGAVPAAS